MADVIAMWRADVIALYILFYVWQMLCQLTMGCHYVYISMADVIAMI